MASYKVGQIHANIRDFGAVGDGVTDDGNAFIAFNTWAKALTVPVFLEIPPSTGMYMNTTGSNAGLAHWFVGGISDLTVSAYGATLQYFVAPGPIGDGALGTTTARVQTATAGATTLTCTTPTQAGLFAAGQWLALGSLELQGTNGYPPNLYWCEYCLVTGVNTGTGVITLAEPIRYTHLSTYPVTSTNTGTYDAGGPATVYTLASSWNQRLKVMGLTVNQPNVGVDIQIVGRQVECVDCVFLPIGTGVAPSQSKEIVFRRCELSGVQIDKDIEVLKFIDCTVTNPLGNSNVPGELNFFSSSVDKVLIDGCYVPGGILGMPKNLVVRNTHTSSLGSGPAYGRNESLVVENCTISNINITANANNHIATSVLTFSNGTFSTPISNQAFFPVPGMKCFFNQNGSTSPNWGFPFVITAVRTDGTNVLFDTTLTSVPTFSGTLGNTNIQVIAHQAHRLSASGLTGHIDGVMWSRAQKDYPMNTYVRKVFSSDLNSTISADQWGTLVSMTINVIRADTGANGTLTWWPTNQFGTTLISPAGVGSLWIAAIDLKTAGLRTITATTVTGSAGADSLTAPGAGFWFAFGPLNQANTSASIAGNTPLQNAVVEIEITTDQGVTAWPFNAQ